MKIRHRPFRLAFLFLLIGQLTLAAPKTPTASETKAWITDLVEKVRGAKKKKAAVGAFDVEACPKIPSAAWGKLILLGRPVEHELKFAPGCDLDGKLVITMEPFAVDLKVRHLTDVERVTGQVSLEVEPRLAEQEAKLTIHVQDGLLEAASTQETLAFVGGYDLTIGLDGKIKKNSGGKITSSRYRGAGISVTVPISGKK